MDWRLWRRSFDRPRKHRLHGHNQPVRSGPQSTIRTFLRFRIPSKSSQVTAPSPGSPHNTSRRCRGGEMARWKPRDWEPKRPTGSNRGSPIRSFLEHSNRIEHLEDFLEVIRPPKWRAPLCWSGSLRGREIAQCPADLHHRPGHVAIHLGAEPERELLRDLGKPPRRWRDGSRGAREGVPDVRPQLHHPHPAPSHPDSRGSRFWHRRDADGERRRRECHPSGCTVVPSASQR